MSSWIDSEHVRYHGDPCKFNFCWYRDARAGTPAPDSAPAGMTALREALEALTSTLESIEFRVSILGMACTKEDAQRLAVAHTKARAALAAEAVE